MFIAFKNLRMLIINEFKIVLNEHVSCKLKIKSNFNSK